ncbi:hypothetical protein [Mucilaginibacter antarcticus]|uniref:hypothetical protein n=1 Tax=Mucilaginibacter antarcticus TaxID=1855725 RepID=UPI003641223C
MVEWLLIPINEIVKLEIGEKIKGTKKDNSRAMEDVSRYRIMYQPFLVVLPQFIYPNGWQRRLSKVPIWNSRDGVNWTQTINAYDIALSATVTY